MCKQQVGFTLIELIIVIVILGILSSTAIPKFLDLQSDARHATMEGLKASLESASTLTYSKTMIEGLGELADEELTSGLRVRYGYPFANQTSINLVIDYSTELKMYGSIYNVVTFAFVEEFNSANISAGDVRDSELCKLVYTGADKGERPDIDISGCKE